MTFLRCALFLTALAIIATRNVVYAQDEFGQVLLEAFTTGMFNGESADPAPAAPVPTQTPAANAFPAVTLQPAVPEVSSEFLSESPEETFEELLDESPEGSPEETLEGSPEESSENIIDESPEESLGESPEESPEETPEPSSADMEPSPTAIVPIEDDVLGSPEETTGEEFDNFSSDEEGSMNGVLTVYKPIRVNCGSFDERNTFSQDTKSWFNKDSVAVEDPFAAAQFDNTAESLLYSTYRYAAQNLTYTVPVPTEGVWRVTLQWAEIVPVFMREGARVFLVSLSCDNTMLPFDTFYSLLLTFISGYIFASFSSSALSQRQRVRE